MTINLANIDLSSDITSVYYNENYITFNKVNEEVYAYGKENTIKVINIQYENLKISNIIGIIYNGFRINTTRNEDLGKRLNDENRQFCSLEILE